MGTSSGPSAVRSGARRRGSSRPSTSWRATPTACPPPPSTSGPGHGVPAHPGSPKPPPHAPNRRGGAGGLLRGGGGGGGGGVGGRGDPPRVAQEGQAALADAGRLELVGQHRGERDGQGSRAGLQQVEQGQVGRRDRLPQPLLAE